MIVAQRKKIPELVDILQGKKKILVLGCGICASECPACAIQLNHFESRQFNAMLENLLEHHLTVDCV